MREIKKILVALDGSAQSFKSLQEAIYLARQCGATITGLCVLPLYTISLGKFTTSLRNQSIKEAKKFMAKAKVLSAQNGIVFNEKIVVSNHTSKISEFASDKKFDLIVMGSRGMNPLKELFLGSVANYTVHKSTIPVLVVK
ncbi:MAG: universal stress protein [Thaumarchaeota archaeon]|nr:universal stress protein [Nitrososphaerota archaeon]